MPATKSSKTSPTSKAQRNRTASGWLAGFGAWCLLALVGSAAAWFFWSGRYTTWYGDAEAHLNIARRIVDSGQPGYDQIGTVWLPLPHLMMAMLVRSDAFWTSGLGGTIPGVFCYTLAGLFLFLASRRVFGDLLGAFVATAVFALNPNLLYLQSAPMTEPVFFAALCGMLYGTVTYAHSGSIPAVLLTAICSLAASLTRYEGWALIPVVATFFLLAGPRRWSSAILFCVLASLAPLWWLGHNWWFYGNPLQFYVGPDSAKGIYQRALDQGMARYPGDGDWNKAVQYFSAAAMLAVGRVTLLIGVVGVLIALARRWFWPVVFLAIPPAFYILSMHGSGTPIFVPHLWPFSYYNTRYGLAILPLAAFGAGALVAMIPGRLRGPAAVLTLLAVTTPWLLHPHLDNLICWKESQVNSVGRRAWTQEAANYLTAKLRPGDRIRMPFGDTTGILRYAGIPLRNTVHEGDSPIWDAGIARPDLFLFEQWIVCISGDPLCSAVFKTMRSEWRYEKVKVIAVKDAKPIEIYRRDLAPRLPVPKEEEQQVDEDPIHESARGSE